MAFPFLACLLLAGIHVYLGIHVIARKVIFVDLALAQIAALGSVCGVLLGYDVREDPWMVKGYSLLFALLGAAVFSVTRARRERVPQEAIIGIAYALALASTVLATAQLPHGSEQVRALLTGSILWVRGETVLVTALLYAAIGLVLALCHRPLLRISEDPEGAIAKGMRVRLWDFLFYTLFGFVVTSSVGIAGVLLVFAYLVIPAVIAVQFANRVSTRLAIGWGCGTLVSFFGVMASYYADLPSGPTIAVTFGLFLVLATLVHVVTAARRKVPVLLRIGGGALALGLVAGGSLLLRKPENDDPVTLLESPIVNERLFVIETARSDDELWEAIRDEIPGALEDPDAQVRATAVTLLTERDAREALYGIEQLLVDPDDHVRESALRSVRHFRSPASAEPLARALASEKDAYLRVDLAHALLELGDRRGLSPLLDVMDTGTASQMRKEAWETLRAHTPVGPRFDPRVDPGDNDETVGALRRWIETDPPIQSH